MAFVADASGKDSGFAPTTVAGRHKGAACGRTFTQADERQVAAGDGALHRCVEFDGMLLTVTGGCEVAEVVEDGGELRVLASESYLEARHQVHVVDVQGEREAFVLLVVAREEDKRIVSMLKFS